MFVGTFEHTLDDKGRVVLPSTFRGQLPDKGFISQLDQCLGLWTEDGFAEVAERLTEKIREGAAPQGAMRAFSANAHEIRADSQGRVTIPQRLRDFADLQRDVVVIGNIGRIELWNPDRWHALSPTSDEDLTQAVTALGL